MRALVVEDEVQIAAEICAHLTQAGYVVETVADGEEAWSHAGTEDFDGIVLDLGLPRLDGLSVVRQLRAAGVTTPILVLTARGTWTERVAGIDAGADDYLPKPFDPEELNARIRAVLRRTGKQAVQGAETLEVNGIKLSPGTREVWAEGTTVDLTTIEFDILDLIARSAGRVVSRHELTAAIHQRPASPLDRSLDVHVSHIRKKLGRQGGLIRTVRGVGYLFRAELLEANEIRR
jgi:DNA-binding response OmpR family regulator